MICLSFVLFVDFAVIFFKDGQLNLNDIVCDLVFGCDVFVFRCVALLRLRLFGSRCGVALVPHSALVVALALSYKAMLKRYIL